VPLLYVTGAKLTLKNGSMSNATQCAMAEENGEIIIESGTYNSSRHAAFIAGTNGMVTVNGGTISGQEGAVTAPSGKGTITVNGGKLSGKDNFAIATNGSNGRGGNVITLNNGELEGFIESAGYEAIGVYIANNDIFVMNGGSIKANGGAGICMRGGDVTINDGTIIATGEPGTTGKIGDGNFQMGKSAIIYHEKANYPGKEGMRLTINGGTITGVDHSLEVLSNEAEPQVFVTGGEFTPAYPENNAEEPQQG